MKLKTLKDIEWKLSREYLPLNFKQDLRQEAIKWIKSDLEKEYKEEAQSVRHWIIWFFNITEEELK